MHSIKQEIRTTGAVSPEIPTSVFVISLHYFNHIHGEREGKTLDHVTSSWGEACWVITSKIVILCYYASIPCLIYIINYCKNIQIN